MTSISQSTIQDLLALMGSRYRLLVAPTDESSTGEGGDVDAAVEALDPLWALRLPDDWQLCQALRYDVTGWYWVLRSGNEVLKLDSLDDSRGLGRYRFPTSVLMTNGGPGTPQHLLAAYLVSKRLRKGIRDPDYWQRISNLASSDPIGFAEILGRLFGSDLGARLAAEILDRSSLSEGSWNKARRTQTLRALRNPLNFTKLQVMRARRILFRVTRPSGLVVLVAGPDGAGKSTLADALPLHCQGLFRRFSRQHWRPGILPTPGSLAGRAPRDTSQPHARQPHGKFASAGLLVYHWLDFFIGGWVRWFPAKIKTTLVVVERGWWDIAVDPRRYRLSVSPRMVKALGRTLPQPDLLLLLEAPGGTLADRKGELDREEASRQTAEWRNVPDRSESVILDASLAPSEVASKATNAVAKKLEARAVSRLGTGWTGVPPGRNPRWTLPRGPRATARRALDLYQPTSTLRKLGWESARILAALGAFRLLPRASAPPAEVRRVLAPHIPARGTVAVTRTNQAGRYVALLIEDSGRAAAFAKIALDQAGMEKLAVEVQNQIELGRLLPSPLRTPAIIETEPGLILMEALPWKGRIRPWRLDPDLARAMGAFSKNGHSAVGAGMVAHGDFVPWNLLESDDYWVLLDWEEAGEDYPAFFDLFHFLVQGYSRLGKPTLRDLADMFEGRGWAANALSSFAQGASLDVEGASLAFLNYLELSKGRLDLGTREGLSGLEARQRLLRVTR